MSKIHGYDILDVKEGGMARVFHCRKPDGIEVALKQVRPDKAQDNPSLFRKFVNATEMLKKLSNGPYIVKAFGVYNDLETQTTLLEMEWIDGPTFDEYAERRRKSGRPLTNREIKKFTRQILEGLSYAHSKGILHLDIKPKNLIVSEGVIRIIDFGIAKTIGENAELVHGTNKFNTTTNGETGTSNWFSGFYSPIEQRLGKKMNFSTDIYALGRTLHVIITGEEDEDLNIEDPELCAFVEKCTAKQKDRFQSAEEALNALENGIKSSVKKCINPECGKSIPVNAKFCPYCSTEQKEKEYRCENGHKMSPGQKFCCECGAGPATEKLNKKEYIKPKKVVGYHCNLCKRDYRDPIYGDKSGVKFCTTCGADKHHISLIYE